MTAQQCHDYFNLLTDKVESAYFTVDEIDSLLTQASIEYVKRTLPSAENQGINLETDEINYGNLYSLTYNTAGLNMSSSGVITVSAVQSALNTASSSTEAFMAILGASWTKSGATYPVKWTRLNNYWKDVRNPFKSGDAVEPIYKFDKTNFTFSPIDVSASVVFTLLKQPKAVDLDAGTTIELPSHVHKAVVELAVDLASTSIRDEALKSMNSAG